MKKLLRALFFSLVFLFFPLGVYAQSCVAPADVTGVLVEYPYTENSESSWVQASCKWNALADVTSYTYTITEVESGTQVQSASVGTETLKVAFPITQGKTYKCDVYATNACGASGGAGTHSLLCEADALIDTPTPTPVTAGPTATPLPTKPPIAPSGTFETTALILGGVTLVIIGGLALLLL